MIEASPKTAVRVFVVEQISFLGLAARQTACRGIDFSFLGITSNKVGFSRKKPVEILFLLWPQVDFATMRANVFECCRYRAGYFFRADLFFAKNATSLNLSVWFVHDVYASISGKGLLARSSARNRERV